MLHTKKRRKCSETNGLGLNIQDSTEKKDRKTNGKEYLSTKSANKFKIFKKLKRNRDLLKHFMNTLSSS